MRRSILLAVVSLSAMLCVGVSALPAQPGGAPIADLFAYCNASGTRDTVRPLPSTLRNAAAAALSLPPGGAGSEGYFWRCMDRAVYVCAVGANIPCQLKADAARRNAGAAAFCREKPDTDVVPAYATGHRTIYEWRCVSGAAVPGKAVMLLDRRGFQADFWRRLPVHETG